MSIDTDDALTFDPTGTPGATNQSVPTRPTNDRFGEILSIVGTAVMGALPLLWPASRVRNGEAGLSATPLCLRRG
jgi:hypothetical protein